MNTTIYKFDVHVGPVSALSFHPEKPMFVSEGHDRKIKVFNLMPPFSSVTIQGHAAPIRTTFFHKAHPWIISSADDNTARIWNWETRTCLRILNGHKGSVMCARFFTSEDLIASASLDRTVRIWDISGLCKYHSIGAVPPDTPATVSRQILDNHSTAVNWFDVTLGKNIISCSKTEVIIWTKSEDEYQEHSRYSKVKDVSYIYTPNNAEFIIFDSHRRFIHVWDDPVPSDKYLHHSFRCRKEDYNVVSGHPNMNMFAAGGETGMRVFKIIKDKICCH